ncbi:MAG TPA: O-antigen ligase family protein, partial [Chloroflexota bacterium]
MSSTGTTVQVAVRSRESTVADVSWRGLWPLLLPCGLLVAGALVGYPFTLDVAVARERLLGLIVAGALAVLVTWWLRRVERPAAVLVGATVVSLAGGVWIISATGPDVFRGSVGRGLQVLFGPIFGLARVTDPVEVANTRFIVGYNGLVDLCAVAIFCCGALILERREFRSTQTRALLATIALGLLLLVGTGARGGLTGLAAGIVAIGLYAWPRRSMLGALIAAPIALAVAAIGLLDKGVEFSSTAGRLSYWTDLARLLSEYPLTGVGLGVDTAFRATLQYEINPDPERVFYAHNTFVQSYLESGPLGTLGMLLIPLVALAAALCARRFGARPRQRALTIAGLGIVGALTAHGLTDQVVTTNIGTATVLLGLAAVLAGLSPAALASLSRLVGRGSVAVGALGVLVLVPFLVTPGGRAQALLNLGSLELNQALALEAQAPARAAALADAESTLALALTQADGHSGVLRELARVRSARYDDA